MSCWMDLDELQSSEVLLRVYHSGIYIDSSAFFRKSAVVRQAKIGEIDSDDDKLCSACCAATSEIGTWLTNPWTLDSEPTLTLLVCIRYFIGPSCRQSFLSLHCCIWLKSRRIRPISRSFNGRHCVRATYPWLGRDGRSQLALKPRLSPVWKSTSRYYLLSVPSLPFLMVFQNTKSRETRYATWKLKISRRWALQQLVNGYRFWKQYT